MRAEEKAPEPREEKEPVVINAIPKDALVMDALQVKIGSTRFLNGNWRVALDVKDPGNRQSPCRTFPDPEQ